MFGYLADKTDKRYIILFGTIGILITAYPFISSLKAGSSAVILAISMFLGILIRMTEGTLNPLVAESFPTQIRATSVAFCWNFTSVAFGGISPIIAMMLIKDSGSIDAVAYHLISICSVSLIGILFTLIDFKTESQLSYKAN